MNPNTGVWLMRSSRSAFEFLDAVEAAGPQPGPWADQGAVLAALGWDRGDERYHWAGPGPGSRFLAGTSWLPPGWNQPYLEGRTDENCYNGSAASYVGRPDRSGPVRHPLHGDDPDGPGEPHGPRGRLAGACRPRCRGSPGLRLSARATGC